MPTRNDSLQVLIGGRVHDSWDRAEADSDLLVPADAWHVSLGTTSAQSLPTAVAPGAPVEIRIDGERIMTGRVDAVTRSVERGRHDLSLSGRDGAAVLVDCSAPIFSARQVGLADVAAKIVKPLGVTRVRIDAVATRTREKVNVEPGDTAWDALANVAAANGLWPWFEPDGTLVVGGPDYTTAPVATLVLRTNGTTNVERLEERRSIAGRHSRVTVLGQTHGTETESGKHALRATVEDTGVSWYRPRIAIDHEADNTAVCASRARKIISDGRLGGYSLTATVKGFRIVAPGEPGNGLLWAAGQRVHVVSEPHGIDAPMFIMARRFSASRAAGTSTELTLAEDGVWAIEAHPHKRKHRRGKNSLPGKIIDLSGGAQ
ncbi:phage baseplate assembly protein [Denitromonas halophila]|uniref:Phage tail protein n=1 Tax=Denitromonas halophila TaxID=1629404 RepID=A0A557QX75_9RHOO|nr:phage tail protein [Denitromonas halophila]TVO57520.1 phage tail protein [Denitromonas halophila]